MHIPPQIAQVPTFQRPDPNLSKLSARSQWLSDKRRVNTQFKKTLSEKPQFDKHDVARGPIVYEQGCLSLLNGTFSALAGLGMPVPAFAIMPITGPLQLATIAEAIVCIGRRSRIKKGKGKYSLQKPGSYGRVRKYHLSYDAAMRSLLKRTIKGNPASKPYTEKPFAVHCNAKSVPQGYYKFDRYSGHKEYVTPPHPISRSGLKTVIYTRDRDLANRCYQSALKDCQYFLRTHPHFVSKNPQYKPLLDWNG